jgi:hypothetical protein
MAVRDAQKSEVHATTDDAAASPGSNTSQMAGDPGTRPADADRRPPGHDEAQVRAEEQAALAKENTDEDRSKLFPPGTKVIQDDSDEGGPIRIETPNV